MCRPDNGPMASTTLHVLQGAPPSCPAIITNPRFLQQLRGRVIRDLLLNLLCGGKCPKGLWWTIIFWHLLAFPNFSLFVQNYHIQCDHRHHCHHSHHLQETRQRSSWAEQGPAEGRELFFLSIFSSYYFYIFYPSSPRFQLLPLQTFYFKYIFLPGKVFCCSSSYLEQSNLIMFSLPTNATKIEWIKVFAAEWTLVKFLEKLVKLVEMLEPAVVSWLAETCPRLLCCLHFKWCSGMGWALNIEVFCDQ